MSGRPMTQFELEATNSIGDKIYDLAKTLPAGNYRVKVDCPDCGEALWEMDAGQEKMKCEAYRVANHLLNFGGGHCTSCRWKAGTKGDLYPKIQIVRVTLFGEQKI